MKFSRWLILVLWFFKSQASCQVIIWQEGFDGYPDGSLQAANNNIVNPSPDWEAEACVACIDTADWWEIRSGVLEARDVNQLVFVQTEAIDIAGLLNVSFSIDVNESGDHEGLYFGLDACGDQDKEDYVNVLYRIDGGPWILVENFLGWCGLYNSCGNHTLYGDDGINSGDCRDNDSDWGSTTVVKSGLSGNSLELRVEALNSSTSEIIRFDNLRVMGTITLPVVISMFEVNLTGRIVLLEWQTINESGNDYYEVERSTSTDPMDWETIGRIQGAGDSNSHTNYIFEDPGPYVGRTFYRLKQVDYDGSYRYSSIKSVKRPHITKPFPNPASNYLMVPVMDKRDLQIRLFSQSSIELYINSQKIEGYRRLDLSNIDPGYYTLSVNNHRYKVLISK